METALRLWVGGQLAIAKLRDDERGEGIISTAIAVLIMALIGLLMWTLFERVFTDAGSEIESNVNQIGS